MSKLESERKYEEVKNLHKATAREKEQKIKQDLSRLMSSATPRFLREKLVMGCVVFGSVYLVEEIVFKKKVPGIVKFVGAVSATVFAPKIYHALYTNFHKEPALSPPTQPYVNGHDLDLPPA